MILEGFPSGSAVKNLPVMQDLQETQVQSLGQEDPVEEGMATHSSTLAWRIMWTEQSVGLCIVHKVAKNQAQLNRLSTHECILEISMVGTSLVVQWLRLCSQCRVLRSSGGEARSHMLQLEFKCLN